MTTVIQLKASEITNDHLYAVKSHAYLLECVMATYSSLLAKKSSPKGEIDRHESIIKDSFMAMASDFQKTRFLPSFKAKWHTTPRLFEILDYMSMKGDNAEEAVCRYINKNRYGVGK